MRGAGGHQPRRAAVGVAAAAAGGVLVLGGLLLPRRGADGAGAGDVPPHAEDHVPVQQGGHDGRPLPHQLRQSE